ncbi:T9SS type A sorting domain-containing protein [Flavobacterium pallidum]|uniref:Secretion system C-terminal sorting domain-containing protein n=1 Tax=Flavobacterium pallidum TaxID=2172098 RepID=A0A2S1SDV3_9FLAO|nr:T9SS type A sorting domain-containing protein [Flavobacterium pallidum]AWI24580.1 hypothetical protein HYN49_00980 [Flavobacterium pallidum]
MKKFLALLLLTTLSYGQSWQWGKRGGSNDVLDTQNIQRQEETYGIATDSEKNIYAVSKVGITGLDVDGHPKTNYGDSTTKTDVCISSFSCDGTYRWSKIFGGGGQDNLHPLQVDSQDNIYAAGAFGEGSGPDYAQHIDEDMVFPTNPVNYQSLTLIKYNKDGVLQWYRKPQPANVTQSESFGQAASRGMATDGDGTTYWFVVIPPGTYANGAFVNTLPGSNYFILKYDTNGNFLGAIPLDIQTVTTFGLYIQFYRNPNNGYFYITSRKGGTSASAIVGGQQITHALFLACFNNQGQFQWVRENTNTSTGSLTLYNLVFDSDNNIYIGGRMTGFNNDSFMGLSIPESIIPGFVMKVNPTAENLIWSSYNNKGTNSYGAIALNGNELGFTSHCFDPDFTWGSQVLNANAGGVGQDVLLARFNKETGACISLAKIPGDPGYDDRGTALAVDVSGDYILGGAMGHNLTFGNGTITNAGSQSDFFIAKYATSACSPLQVEAIETGSIKVYPNPVGNKINVMVSQTMSYTLFNISGTAVLRGNVSNNNNSIDVSALASGNYVLQLTDGKGDVRTAKIVKR